MLDALDLSPLALDALDKAIAALDAVDRDVDLEDGHDAEHDAADMEDDGTSEPMLGAPERHPSAPFFSHFFRSSDGRQLLWGQGRNDGEPEPGYDLACDEDEMDDDGLACGEGCESDGGEPYLSVVEFDGQYDNWWRSGRQTQDGYLTDFEECDPVDRQAAAARPAGASAQPSAGYLAMRAQAQKRGRVFPADGLARPWIGAPDVFGLRVQGNCCAPHILDGGAVHVDQRAEPQADDFVAIFFEVERAGQRVMQGWVKRMSVGLPRDMQCRSGQRQATSSCRC